MGVAFAIQENTMNNNILCSTQMVRTNNGKCLSVQMFDDTVRRELVSFGVETSTTYNVPFVDDSRAKGGMVVCRDRKEANTIVARNVERAESKRDSIRALSSRKQAYWTRELGREFTIIVEHMEKVRARSRRTSVELSTDDIRIMKGRAPIFGITRRDPFCDRFVDRVDGERKKVIPKLNTSVIERGRIQWNRGRGIRWNRRRRRIEGNGVKRAASCRF